VKLLDKQHLPHVDNVIWKLEAVSSRTILFVAQINSATVIQLWR